MDERPQMKERSNRELELVRVVREQQVQDLLDRAAGVSKHSWQFRHYGTYVFTTRWRSGLPRSCPLRSGGSDRAF
ncbi:MAG: hypothetical protein HONDAALG_03440 [Gammaproteobacteria bacterium]|nr:hypothetical protein [Gammaproteobacteria bacterium]